MMAEPDEWVFSYDLKFGYHLLEFSILGNIWSSGGTGQVTSLLTVFSFAIRISYCFICFYKFVMTIILALESTADLYLNNVILWQGKVLHAITKMQPTLNAAKNIWVYQSSRNLVYGRYDHPNCVLSGHLDYYPVTTGIQCTLI